MQQPQWLAAAWTELGQREVSGAADNARIRAFFRDVGQPPGLHDEVAWCAAFVGACLERAGVASTRSLMARSYLRWGEKLDEVRFGAVAVLSRGSDPSAGHVGFLIGETQRHVVLLGGNQGDAVSVAAFPKARLVGLRWPQSVPAAEPAERQPADDGEAMFARALAHVLEMEGGISDDPYDPGGLTNKGITLGVYAEWKSALIDDALKAELKAIPDAAVRDIYLQRYWRPAHCAEMVPALAFFHFDTAVNHGVTGATRLLQRAVGTDVDGEIGPNTRSAIARLPVEEILQRYADVRRARYRALPHFWRFGRGWLARVDRTLTRARAIAAEQQDADTTFATSISPDQQGAIEMTNTANDAEGTDAQGSGTASTNTPATDTQSTDKWWAHSVTIWGVIITALSTVLPTLGPVIGIDITGDLVNELGNGIVQTVQAVGGLVGTLLTIYGRMRASTSLTQRSVKLKL